MVDYKMIDEQEVTWGGKRPGAGRPKTKAEVRVGDTLQIKIGQASTPFEVVAITDEGIELKYKGNGYYPGSPASITINPGGPK